MALKESIKQFWAFLKKDTWQSWLVSLILIIVIIKFVFFPLLSLITSSSLPLVVIESCSMYHSSDFNEWWQGNKEWYESKDITISNFEEFSFKNGLNKGDIIFVIGKEKYKQGEIIIFNSETKYPIIHRIISTSNLSTKGDNNPLQLDLEKDIQEELVIGKAVGKIPYLGWVKLIFFNFAKSPDERGFCSQDKRDN